MLPALIVAIIVILGVILFLPMPEDKVEQAEPTPSEQKADEEEDKVAKATLVKQGMMAPDFTVEMFDGREQTLSELKGKVVLLTFWATWCPPCRMEMTHVEKEIIEHFKGQDFVFLPISRGEKKEAVETFRTQNGYTFPMGLDPEMEIYKKYASNYIPRNFLVNASGEVILTSVGFDEEEFKTLIATIEQALKK